MLDFRQGVWQMSLIVNVLRGWDDIFAEDVRQGLLVFAADAVQAIQDYPTPVVTGRLYGSMGLEEITESKADPTVLVGSFGVAYAEPVERIRGMIEGGVEETHPSVQDRVKEQIDNRRRRQT